MTLSEHLSPLTQPALWSVATTLRSIRETIHVPATVQASCEAAGAAPRVVDERVPAAYARLLLRHPALGAPHGLTAADLTGVVAVAAGSHAYGEAIAGAMTLVDDANLLISEDLSQGVGRVAQEARACMVDGSRSLGERQHIRRLFGPVELLLSGAPGEPEGQALGLRDAAQLLRLEAKRRRRLAGRSMTRRINKEER